MDELVQAAKSDSCTYQATDMQHYKLIDTSVGHTKGDR